MSTNQKAFDHHDRYTRLARMAATHPHTDDYQRGYLRGLRSRCHREQFLVHDEHARWIKYGDGSTCTEFGRGYLDGLAGLEPQS
jgi:hypothetical protein